MSAVTQNEYTGNGSTDTYSFTFPYLKASDIKVSLDAVVTTAFTLPNATTIQFNTAPASGVKIKIFRETSVDNLTATFYAGSAIKSEDLNDNFTQNLFVTQEVNQRAMSSLGATMTGELQIGTQGSLTFEGSTDDANETTLTVIDPTADRTITLPNETGEVVVDTLPSAKIFVGDSNNKVSEVTVTGDIAISNTGVTTIQPNAVESGMIGENEVTTSEVNDSLTNANIASDAEIAVSKLANGTARQILQTAANGTDVEFTDNIDVPGTLDVTNAATFDNNVSITGNLDISGTTGITAADVTSGVTKVLVETSDDSQIKHGDAGSIRAFINVEDGATADQDDEQIKTAYENNTNTNAYTDSEKNLVTFLAGTDITPAVAVTSSVQNQINNKQDKDDQLDTLSGMHADTASKLAVNTALTSDIADLNIVDGMTKETGSNLTNTDSSFPTSAAVVSYVAGQIAPLGGLEVVATDAAFPYTQPASGVVISISDAGGVAFNGSGTSTTGRTVTGPNGEAVQTVTINNAPSSLNNETLVAGVGLMVSSTGSGQIYNYHKILGKEDDIKQLSDDINDFNARYRVGTADDLTGLASGTLDGGDLFFNTTTGKLLVYNNINTAWEEAQSIGNFFISTFSEAFDGSRTQFTISNAPSNVQQILLSLNGVIQKPGTAFTLSGSTVTLASAPASGTEYFAVVMGSTVNIGQPSANTVDTLELKSGAVTNDKVSAVTSDRIAGSKINPVFTSNIEVQNNGPGITFTDGDNDNDFYIQVQSGNFNVVDSQATTASPAVPYRFKIDSNGNINANGNLIVHNGYLEMVDQDIYIPAAIKHSGDTNTGISFPANDEIQLTTGGNSGIYINSSQQIGIGTTSPTSGYNVDIQGAGAPAVKIQDTDVTNGYLEAAHNHGNSYLVSRNGSANGTYSLYQNNGTATTTPLYIDALGRTMLQTTSAGYPSYADNLTLENAGHCGITIRCSSAGQGSVYYADAAYSTGSDDGSYAGYTIYDHSDNTLRFGTDHDERFRIGSVGQLGVGTSAAYGNAGEALVSQGASAAPQWAAVKDVTIGSQVDLTTVNGGSNTSYVVNSIPNNAYHIRLTYADLSSHSSSGGTNDIPVLRVGNSGGIKTSGYRGWSFYIYHGQGASAQPAGAQSHSGYVPLWNPNWHSGAYHFNGFIDLHRVYCNSSNQNSQWVMSGQVRIDSNSDSMGPWWGTTVDNNQRNTEWVMNSAYNFTGGETLDRLELNANKSGTSGVFDTGVIQLYYWT